MDDDLGGFPRPKRAEVERGVLANAPDHRQSRVALVGQLHPVRTASRSRATVVPGPVLADEAKLHDFCLELGCARLVIDAIELTEHAGDGLAIVAVEIGLHPGPKVLGLPHIHDGPIPVQEEVDAGPSG